MIWEDVKLEARAWSQAEGVNNIFFKSVWDLEAYEDLDYTFL